MQEFSASTEELLKFAVEHGMLNLVYAKDTIEMQKKKDLLKKHPYSIWEGKDGNWRTRIPGKDGKNKLVKRKTRESIEDVVIEYWKSNSEHTFKKQYAAWIDRQKLCGRSDNTIMKYESDYLRFFKNDPFENIEIADITDEDIATYLNRLLGSKKIQYRALKGMFGYMNGVFQKSIIDKLITINPCTYIDLPMFKSKCYEPAQKTAKERTLSDEEKNTLLQKIRRTETDSCEIITAFAVELSLYTGMRVGELSGLMWEDIDFQNNTITICRSEKFNRKTREFYISGTKNNKVRTIPLTEEMRDVLYRVKKAEMNFNFLGEFVFQNEDGRVHAPAISWCAADKTSTKEFTNTKSIHAIRRTLNSNLRCMGVPETVAAAILGHSEQVNERNYTYDVSSLQEKYDFLKQAGKIS